MSTSGNSKNVIKALEEAKKKNIITIGFTGKTNGNMKPCCDYLINIPSMTRQEYKNVTLYWDMQYVN